MARRSARPCLMGTPSFRRRGASRRATSGFSVPGAVLPGCDGTRAGSPIRAASAALRRRRVQPLKAAGRNAGGRLARASRGWGYESRPRAPHRRCRVTPISAPLRRLHHRDVSRRRPQSSRTPTMIRAEKRAGISFLFVVFSLFPAHPEEHRVSDASRRMGRPMLRDALLRSAPQHEAERCRCLLGPPHSRRTTAECDAGPCPVAIGVAAGPGSAQLVGPAQQYLAGACELDLLQTGGNDLDVSIKGGRYGLLAAHINIFAAS